MIFLFNWVIFEFHVEFQGCLYTVVKVDGESPLPSSLAISKVP